MSLCYTLHYYLQVPDLDSEKRKAVVVKEQWIDDSLNSGRMLPTDNYLI